MFEDSISVVKVRNVILVTMPEDPGDDIISSLQEKVLQEMQRHLPDGVIMDISTVEIMDSFFARTIIETAQMIKLMGGRTIISGMRPSVAITATQLGLVFQDIETALNVDTSLDIIEAGVR